VTNTPQVVRPIASAGSMSTPNSPPAILWELLEAGTRDSMLWTLVSTQKIAFLQNSLKELETEEADIKEQIDARIQELTKAKSEVVRDSIEKSIIELEQGREENGDRKLGVHHTILELENLISKNESLFGEYSGWIHSVMKKPTNLQKKGLKELISSLILRETQIKVALSGV